MNHLIKQQLAKICQEANLNWSQALPLALLWIRVKQRLKEKLSCFEMLYGRTYTVQYQGEDLNEGAVMKTVYTFLTISSHSTTHKEWENLQPSPIFTKRGSQLVTLACQFEANSPAWPVIMVNLYAIPSQNPDFTLSVSCMSAECSYSFNIQEDSILSCIGYLVENQKWRRASR